MEQKMYEKVLGKVTMTCDGLHSLDKLYDRLCMVFDDQHRTYISIKEVPANISLKNTSYWQPVNTITPDGEDISVDDQLRLKLADRTYNPADYSGYGKKILRKNFVDGVNIINQLDIADINTVYTVRYEYDLLGNTITIPSGCVLSFEGGSFTNGTVVLTNTKVFPQALDIDEVITNRQGTFANG